jgi:hypothetical protein
MWATTTQPSPTVVVLVEQGGRSQANYGINLLSNYVVIDSNLAVRMGPGWAWVGVRMEMDEVPLSPTRLHRRFWRLF